nr:hypothetical protein [Mammaliicoccus sp. Marseille-Q6498]
MTHLELSLMDYQSKNITLNNFDDLKIFYDISEHIDLIDCKLKDIDIDIQTVLNELSKFRFKHIKLKMIMNTLNSFNINQLSFDGILIKNIQKEGRYLVFNLYVTELLENQKKNNDYILNRVNHILSRKQA